MVKCIIAFARAIKKSVPEFAGPHLIVGQDQAPPPVDMHYLEQNQPTVFRSPTGPRLFGTPATATPSPNGAGAKYILSIFSNHNGTSSLPICCLNFTLSIFILIYPYLASYLRRYFTYANLTLIVSPM